MGNFSIMQVYIAGRSFRQIAHCDCGWSGADRWTRGSANLDAGIHAAQTGHLPVPLSPRSIPASPALVLQAS